MRNYYKPKRQDTRGNKYFNFLNNENRLVKLLDISMIKDMFEARGKFDSNDHITGWSEKGERIWTF